MEIELKLLIERQHAESLRQSPLLQQYAAGAPRTMRLVDTYFDTPALDICNSDAGLRVREIDGALLQTFKGGGKITSGLHSRHEWETPLGAPQPDLPTLRKQLGRHGDWARLLRRPDLAASLDAAFRIDMQRTAWDLRLPQGDLVELALDEGEITSGEHKAAISEVEIELKSGRAEHLFDFGLALLEEMPLQLADRSKAARGYALSQAQPPVPLRAQTLTLARSMTVEHGMRAIFANCLGQINGNAAIIGADDDPEGIHQMRVGVRRLRSALRLFRDAAPCPPDLLTELKWLADALGQARDWEVLEESTLPRIAAAAATPALLAPLHDQASAIARARHQDAAAAVASPRFTRLMLRFGAWMAGMRWRDGAQGGRLRKLQAPLHKFARKVLARDHARLLRRGRRLAHADAPARHELRIAAKKTRYAAEFFRSLYPQARLRTYVRTLSALQDSLGWLNDAAVADGLLAEVQAAPGTSAELAGAAGYARGSLDTAAALEQPALLAEWRDFTQARRPWPKSKK